MMNKMRKMKNKKGFTLMEMLIVVAIIAILIASAIPTFAASLNKARVATDEANIRSGYAQVMTEVLTGDFNVEEGKGAAATYVLQKDGTVIASTGTNANANAYKTVGKPSAATEIAGMSVNAWEKDQTVTYTYSADTGKVTITVGAGA